MMRLSQKSADLFDLLFKLLQCLLLLFTKKNRGRTSTGTAKRSLRDHSDNVHMFFEHEELLCNVRPWWAALFHYLCLWVAFLDPFQADVGAVGRSWLQLFWCCGEGSS